MERLEDVGMQFAVVAKPQRTAVSDGLLSLALLDRRANPQHVLPLSAVRRTFLMRSCAPP